MKTRHFPRAGFLVTTALLALSLLGGCRAFEPEAVVVNQAPETYIIGSPIEDGGGYYHFHVYWYGSDRDGKVERFVWALTDTTLQDDDTVEDEEDENFNPALDASQLEIGHWTTKTDSIFDFKINQGVGTSYDMTLHMVAVDDFGDFDRTPARLHFFSNSLGNPVIEFFRIKQVIDGADVRFDTSAVALGAIDTVGFNRRYEVFWRGTTPNIRGYDLTALAKIDTVYPYDDGLFGYKWKIDGALGGNCVASQRDCWSPRLFNEATGDSFSYFGDITRLLFRNDGSGSSPFRKLLPPEKVTLQVNSIDVAGVEVSEYLREFSFVVNFDPDTRILDREVDFAHADPDTYPYYILLNDPLQVHHPFGSGDRIPDRAYVVCKALGRDHPLDLRRNENYGMGFTGFVTGEIENYSGGRYSFRTSASTLDTLPAWGAGIDGWYADTLGFLVAPRSEMTVNLQAVDEFGRRDGSPASLTFDVGYPPCIQCIEPLPYGQATAPGVTFDCYDPETSVGHPCFSDEAVFYIRGSSSAAQPGRTYLPKMQFEAAYLAIDKTTKFAETVADTSGMTATHYIFLCDVYGMDVLLHGQDDERERYLEPTQAKWRSMAWKTQIDYECDPENFIVDGAGADNIEVINWDVATGDGLTMTSTGLWKKLVRVYVPQGLLAGAQGFRFSIWVTYFRDLYPDPAPDAPEVLELYNICLRQFGQGRIRAVMLDQTTCTSITTPQRPGFYHTFRGLRPPRATPPTGRTWRSCTLVGEDIVIDGSIPLPFTAMASNDDEPVEKLFRIVFQDNSNTDIECSGDGF